jgi:hypothetical protein
MWLLGISTAEEIRFVRTPTAQRVKPLTGVEVSGDAAVLAVVMVTGEGNTPVPDKSVTLVARSLAGPFKSEKRITDKAGTARIPLDFDLPLGSLDIDVQACLTESDVCTDTERLSLRNWVDVDLGFDVSYLVVPDPVAAPQDVTILSDNVFSMVLWPRVQVTLWETQYNWKYYGLSVYGTVPGIFQDRSVLIPEEVSAFTFRSVDRKVGLGDFAAGVILNLRGNVTADVAYNGRTGKLNLVDSIRTLGQPRAVNLGDGFESIDANVQLSHVVAGRGPLLLASAAGSRARPRTYGSGDRAERGDFYQTTTGIGFIRKSRRSAILFWGGYARYEAIYLIRAGTRQVVSPNRDDWMVGVTRIGIRRGLFSFNAGAFAGGLGREQIYIGLNLRLDFHLF